jgi:hypothetical protein
MSKSSAHLRQVGAPTAKMHRLSIVRYELAHTPAKLSDGARNEAGAARRLDRGKIASGGPEATRSDAVHISDQCNPELIATRGPTLVVVSLDILELLFQLREAIADLAAIEIGLARAGALLPLAACCVLIRSPDGGPLPASPAVAASRTLHNRR